MVIRFSLQLIPVINNFNNNHELLFKKTINEP